MVGLTVTGAVEKNAYYYGCDCGILNRQIKQKKMGKRGRKGSFNRPACYQRKNLRNSFHDIISNGYQNRATAL